MSRETREKRGATTDRGEPVSLDDIPARARMLAGEFERMTVGLLPLETFEVEVQDLTQAAAFLRSLAPRARGVALASAVAVCVTCGALSPRDGCLRTALGPEGRNE